MRIDDSGTLGDVPPPGPPVYGRAETCAECWEPFTSAVVDRWLHRRKWGHNPTSIHPVLAEPDRHAQMVEEARRYRGVPPLSKDPGR